MKIMTLNVWQGRLERVLLKHLESLDLDIAAMQEAVEFPAKSGGLVTTHQKIGASLGMEHDYFSTLMSVPLGSSMVKFGNLIYAKPAFQATNTIFTRGAYKDGFNFDIDDYNVRAFQHAVLDVDGKPLHILNHHGHHIDAHKLGDDETLRQINGILAYIQKLDGAVIFCGDLNLSPESESVQQIGKVMRNLAVEHGLQTTRSRLTSKKEVCDYIFVNDGVKVNEFHMDETIISDHNALILDFDLV